MPLSQQHRQARITLGLDGDKVLLEQMRAVERLSQPFTMEAYVISEEREVDFLPHLGKAARVEVLDEEQHVRDFHGVLFHAAFDTETSAGFRYKLTFRPWLWFLTQTLDYGIYQDLDAVAILRQVFEKGNFGPVDYTHLTKTYQKRKFCVQYRESDFAFASRLMEDEGIYYYFEHEAARHVLVLCDAPGSHRPCDQDSIPLIQESAARPDDHDQIWRWREQVSTTGHSLVNLRNFDFQKPQQPVDATFDMPEAHPQDRVETYDYPGTYFVKAEGEAEAQVILEAQQANRRIYQGEGNAQALRLGRTFTLTGQGNRGVDKTYLVTALSYGVVTEHYRSQDEGAEQLARTITLDAVEAATRWRAPIVTPKPVARGPETAVVTGPPGEEIHTDKWGRVKVRFHWDRKSPKDDTSSCWLRVSHNSAGAGFGNVILPRINQEVVVDFLDGDPDRPMVVGRVYNASNMDTYGLPGNKTRSLWRSQTVGAIGDYGGAEEAPPPAPGHNEIYMEDKGKEEMLHVYAQRKMETFVRLDDEHRVYRDQKKRVGRDRTVAIKRHEKKTVEQGDETHTVALGKRTTSIHGNEDLTVTDGDQSTTVKKGNKTVEVSKKDYSIAVKQGKMTVEAMISIELKVGQNTITIDQKGVTIKALMISYSAQATFKIDSPLVTVDASGLAKIQGGLVMIN